MIQDSSKLQNQLDCLSTNSLVIKALQDMLGATDTSTTLNEWAMTEILRNPKIQRKLQSELDAVVGTDRIVEETDMHNFPYLNTIIKETLRLHPANCITLPRQSMADAELAGYHIPKGSTILINLFSMGRDSKVWPRPLEFDPDRWVGGPSGLNDERLYTFGNGRRACPGNVLGTTLVLLSLARLFHGFSWSFPDGVDPASVDMTERSGFSNSLVKKLEAVATPRLAPHLYGSVA